MKLFLRYFLIGLFLINPKVDKAQEMVSFLINDFTDINPAGMSTIEQNQTSFKTFLNRNSYLSIVIPFNNLNSQIGINAQYFKKGELTDIKLGLAYSYSFKFSDDNYFAIGTRFSLYSIRDEYYKYYINDQPFVKTILNSNILNIDAGIWYKRKNIGIGVTYSHINNPRHLTGLRYGQTVRFTGLFPDQFVTQQDYVDEFDPYVYTRELNSLVDYNFNLITNLSFDNNLLFYDLLEFDSRRELTMNNIFKLNDKFLFGTVWDIMDTNNDNRIGLFLMAGISLLEKYKVMLVSNLTYFPSKGENSLCYKRIKPDFECTALISF